MKDMLKRVLSCMLLVVVMISAVPFCVSADTPSSGRKVRVGWYNSDHFQEGAGDEGQKSGYSYEYLQRISNYTGWEYEYIDGGWSELYDAFLDGDIDLLAGVSYTEERSGLMNYPGLEMGFESYYIYKRAGNDAIQGGDLSTLEGKRVGTLENNLMTAYFEEWMSESGAACEEVLFDDFTLRDEAFENGDIDAVIAVNNNVPSNSGYAPVVKVGESSYYLAVTLDRKDLLDELNQALASINESNPYFTQSLQIKYFQNTAVNAALSQAESEWVAEHDKILVGYIEDYIPYSGVDENGNTSGVITDIMGEWKAQLGLEDQIAIEYKPYTQYTDMIAALQAGAIDAAFPVQDNISISEQQGIVQTNDLVESGIHLVYRGEYSDSTTQKIALSDRSPFQRNYVSLHYPDSEIYMANTPEDCLQAVKDGQASCTFFGSGRADGLLARQEYSMLNRMTLEETINYCIGVKKGNNAMYSLLERGISLIDKSNMTNAMYGYTASGSKYTISDFIQEHVRIVLGLALLIIGLIIAVALMLAISLRNARKQQEKEHEMLQVVARQKEELEVTRDHLEEAVEQAEQASRAKTTFLSNMSHDIRTPMNAIIGFTNLAKQSIHEPEKTGGYLEKIEASSSHLLSLINDVLEMSRIESGKLELENGPCYLPGLLDNLHSMVGHLAEDKNQRLVMDCSGIQDENIICDELRLNQVLLNLLSNAVKYTPNEGTIEVRVLQKTGSSEGWGAYEFHVKDNGIGMSPEFAAHVFEAFEREKTSTTSGIQGTGLGMAITKRIVDLMGGRIEVNTAPGEGSEFVVWVEFETRPADKPKTTEDKAENAEIDFANKRLLLVDDMMINREIARTMLEMSGFQVEEADDGTKAVEMVEHSGAGHYDAVLMDIQMPVMNGYDAARAIRALADERLAGIPIIAMTANAFEEDRRNAFEAGMNGHVAKPIDLKELIETLTELLS